MGTFDRFDGSARHDEAFDESGPTVAVHKLEHKWSVWSAHRGEWEGIPGGKAFLADLGMLGDVGEMVVAHLSSTKEIRSGYIEITGTAEEPEPDQQGTRLPGALRARGYFGEHWDEEWGRFDDCPCAAELGGPGVVVDFDIQAASVDELLAAVDAKEDLLIQQSNEEWRAFVRRHRHLTRKGGELHGCS